MIFDSFWRGHVKCLSLLTFGIALVKESVARALSDHCLDLGSANLQFLVLRRKDLR